ncbi:MAG: GNAT family N-acetyltransferase [Polyangiaceae bacterium]|nr:GNAT family N-acetyltransferase [Myxococcales bacterium]MCB9587134.1 GNAT family N-acetyltransferase [Polyangiaceae bacterium]
MSADEVLQTPRLSLNQASTADAAFILELMNEPGWLEHIGNRNVHSLADAERYIRTRLTESYDTHGFGLWVMRKRECGRAIGLCGLVRRGFLRGIDLGFALFEREQGQGLAYEAATSCVTFARERLGERELLAITGESNTRSRALLRKLGFSGGEPLRLPDSATTVLLYQLEL